MTSVKIIPIKPVHRFSESKKWRQIFENAGNMTSKAIEVDFNVTTQTWNHKPDFKIEHSVGKLEWIISTDDIIYKYVSEGTKPHTIVPKVAKMLVFYTGGRPKSRVGWIGSNKGARGTKGPVRTMEVHHPGTTARKFAEAIKAKWDLEWPRQLDRAIRAAK